MNRNKQKPYLEFGGNAYYINLDAILDAIRIENVVNIPAETIEPVIETKPIVESKSKSSRKSKKAEVEPQPNVSQEQIEFSLEQNNGIQVDISKWEILRMMVESIMTSNADVDDKLGMAGLNNNSPIPFKLAFNTLLKYDILQEEE